MSMLEPDRCYHHFQFDLLEERPAADYTTHSFGA